MTRDEIISEARAEGGMFVVIPSVVKLDEELPLSAQMLYGIITWKCNKYAFTWATNRELGEALGVSPKRVSALLSLLEQRGHIETEIEYKDGTNEVLRRYIYPVMKSARSIHRGDPPPKNKDTYPSERAYPSPGMSIPPPENEEVICNINKQKENIKDLSPYSNPTALSDLGATKALQLLALPESERERFLSETHQVDGEEKTVIDMTSRELDRAIKERDEALRSAELARAEQSAAQQARDKIAADMQFANERIVSLNNRAERYSAEARELQLTLDKVTAELETLRARPVEVAVQVDEKAVEAARKEAEAAMRSKLNEAKEAQKKARADLMEVNSALQRAKLDREQAQIELEAVRAQMARAEKKAALASNEDLVRFKELFDRAQEQINRIHGLLLKARGRGADRAEKMSRALLALSDKIREAAS